MAATLSTSSSFSGYDGDVKLVQDENGRKGFLKLIKIPSRSTSLEEKQDSSIPIVQSSPTKTVGILKSSYSSSNESLSDKSSTPTKSKVAFQFEYDTSSKLEDSGSIFLDHPADEKEKDKMDDDFILVDLHSDLLADSPVLRDSTAEAPSGVRKITATTEKVKAKTNGVDKNLDSIDILQPTSKIGIVNDSSNERHQRSEVTGQHEQASEVIPKDSNVEESTEKRTEKTEPLEDPAPKVIAAKSKGGKKKKKKVTRGSSKVKVESTASETQIVKNGCPTKIEDVSIEEKATQVGVTEAEIGAGKQESRSKVTLTDNTSVEVEEESLNETATSKGIVEGARASESEEIDEEETSGGIDERTGSDSLFETDSSDDEGLEEEFEPEEPELQFTWTEAQLEAFQKSEDPDPIRPYRTWESHVDILGNKIKRFY